VQQTLKISQTRERVSVSSRPSSRKILKSAGEKGWAAINATSGSKHRRKSVEMSVSDETFLERLFDDGKMLASQIKTSTQRLQQIQRLL
jgi:hypothetical protein